MHTDPYAGHFYMKLSQFTSVCELLFKHELQARAAGILVAIHADPGVNMTALSKAVICSTGAITGFMDRLEAIGYVTRSQGTSDCRKVTAELTSKGAQFIDSIISTEEAV